MPSTVLTTKGQVTVPLEIRRELGLRTGDRLDFTRNAQTGRIEVSRKGASIMNLCGMLKSAKPPATIDEMHEAVDEAAVERYLHTRQERD